MTGAKTIGRVAVAVLAAAGALWAGCSDRGPVRTIRMATTTSIEDSGLLAHLLPAFEKKHGIRVHVIAVGTGKAIKLGEQGDVDLILVHAREAEDRFVRDGFGVNRRDVMHNDFVILGPAADPAGVKGMRDAPAALGKIARAKGKFVSRGDDSGTHEKEMALWKATKVAPAGKWYLPAGQGMGACLTMADEKRAYVLADRGTYLKRGDGTALEVLVEGDRRLANPYGVIAVNREKHPGVDFDGAVQFIEWIVSPEAQKLIGEFKVNGRVLFRPGAGK